MNKRPKFCSRYSNFNRRTLECWLSAPGGLQYYATRMIFCLFLQKISHGSLIIIVCAYCIFKIGLLLMIFPSDYTHFTLVLLPVGRWTDYYANDWIIVHGLMAQFCCLDLTFSKKKFNSIYKISIMTYAVRLIFDKIIKIQYFKKKLFTFSN